MEKKIHLHTKIKGTFSCKTLKNSSKTSNSKKENLNFLSEIHNLFHMHQLSLTYFVNFETKFLRLIYENVQKV